MKQLSAILKAGANLFETEPVAAVAALNALLDVAVIFGLPITPEQKTAIGVFVGALSALYVRGKVTPNFSAP